MTERGRCSRTRTRTSTGNDDRPPDPQDLAHEREGVSLWFAVREELAGRHEVGFAAFAAARDDAQGDRLVIWTPEEYEALPSFPPP